MSSPRTPSITTDANLDCAFVENALFTPLVDCENSIEQSKVSDQTFKEHFNQLVLKGQRLRVHQFSHGVPERNALLQRQRPVHFANQLWIETGYLFTPVRSHVKDQNSKSLIFPPVVLRTFSLSLSFCLESFEKGISFSLIFDNTIYKSTPAG